MNGSGTVTVAGCRPTDCGGSGLGAAPPGGLGPVHRLIRADQELFGRLVATSARDPDTCAQRVASQRRADVLDAGDDVARDRPRAADVAAVHNRKELVAAQSPHDDAVGH